MKKGFTLIELMVVIVILGILASVAVPKAFRMMCLNDLGACEVNDPETYHKTCEEITDKTPSEYLRRCNDYKAKKNPTTAPTVVETPTGSSSVKPDTVYIVKHDTVFIETLPIDVCINKCKEENKSESLIKFCIKENCVKE